jgi:hypothetical protein
VYLQQRLFLGPLLQVHLILFEIVLELQWKEPSNHVKCRYSKLGIQFPWRASSQQLFSLSPEDPICGTNNTHQRTDQGLLLGSLQPLGETHLLTVPLRQLMRLRHNSFFVYVEHRVDEEIDKALQGNSEENPAKE